MSELYRVIFNGEFIAGTKQAEVQERLAKLFKTDADKLAHWFTGKTIVIKKDLSQAQAEKYRQALQQAGAVAEVQAQVQASAPTENTHSPTWEIAAAGSDVLRPEERTEFTPVDVDTSALRALDNSELDLTEHEQPAVATPDTAHLSVLPHGNIDNIPDRREKVNPDTSKLSIMDP